MDTIRWPVAAAADKSHFPTIPQRKPGQCNDRLDNFPNLAQLSRGPRSRMATACTPHAVRINDVQKKKRRSVGRMQIGREGSERTTQRARKGGIPLTLWFLPVRPG